MNSHWEKEEFEERVTKGIITLYETKIMEHKGINNNFQFTEKMLNRIRKIGCYFPPEDRITLVEYKPGTNIFSANQKLDITNDGFPERAVLCHPLEMINKRVGENMREGSYFEINYLERIDKLPRPLCAWRGGKSFRIIQVWARNDCLEGHANYLTIDKDGNTGGIYWKRSTYDPIREICKSELVCASTCQSKEESAVMEDQSTITASFTHQFWQDRRFLWNVIADEGMAKATFGVYPEQIQSLFYAREMPLTEMGRKRPILHWVAAHQRRIKNGIEIDIEKHLRGITEFIYNGTKFIITRPIKEKQI